MIEINFHPWDFASFHISNILFYRFGKNREKTKPIGAISGLKSTNEQSQDDVPSVVSDKTLAPVQCARNPVQTSNDIRLNCFDALDLHDSIKHFDTQRMDEASLPSDKVLANEDQIIAFRKETIKFMDGLFNEWVK